MARLLKAGASSKSEMSSFEKELERIGQMRFRGLEAFDVKEVLRLLLLLWFRGELEAFHLLNKILPFIGSRFRYVVHSGSDRNVFFFSANYKSRMDHRRLFDSTVRMAPDPSVISSERRLTIRPGHLKNIPNAISWYRALRNADLPAEVCKVFIVYLVEARNTLRWLNKSGALEKAEYFISLFDEYPDEVMIVQFCRKRGIKTAVLQHGAYPGSPSDWENIMTFPYLYAFSPSDRFFLWGDFWKERGVACGVDPSRLLVLGNPKFSENCNKNTALGSSRSLRTVGLVLDANIEMNHESNRWLLDAIPHFCRQRGLRCIVRFHPNCDEQMKEEVRRTVDVEIDESASIRDFSSIIDVAVCARSTVYIELIYWGVPPLRYVSDTALDTYPEVSFGVFDNCDSLSKVFDCLEDGSSQIADEILALKSSFFKTHLIKEGYREELTS